MKTHPLITFPLWGLLIVGIVGGLKVSIGNFTGQSCPHLFAVPICYVVTIAYGLMLGSLMINNKGCKHHFFCGGWALAFIIALFASLAEFFSGGGVCPSASSGGIRAGSSAVIPMCYISLGILVVILVLYIQGPYRRACEIGNG